MKRMSNPLWMACMLACSVGFASAAERDSLKKGFRSYDTNRDGTVTAAELRAPEAFKLLDQDGDGAITLKETQAASKAGLLRGIQLPPPGTARIEAPAANTDSATESTGSDEVRQGPKRLNASELGVGRRIDDLEFVDIGGDRHKLSDFRESKAVVIAMTGTGCPLCLKYAPTLASIEDRYRDQNIDFVWVNPNESESLSRVQKAIDAKGFDGPYVRDLEESITSALGVKTTTEVFVIDSARTLCYRGAVDDQYGFGYARDKPRKNYLTDALDAVIAGERPRVAATSSPGCEMFYSRTGDTVAANSSENTYHNRISRILLNHCVDCHREEGSAPFALQSYESVRDYSQMIGSVVQRRIMPPWFAAESEAETGAEAEAEDTLDESVAVGDSKTTRAKLHWSNDPSLSEADRNDLIAWIDSGATEGNPSDAPLARSYSGEWQIGTPDEVFQLTEPIAIKEEGTMPYKRAEIETELTEDRWIQAVEIRPTDPSVVHHVLVYVRLPNSGTDIDLNSSYFAVYVPGNTFQIYPDGFAKKLPAGSRLVFQLHYTPNGTATSDQTRVGIRYADGPPEHIVQVRGIFKKGINIPPGDPNHREKASFKVSTDVRVLSFMPHMHLRGKAFRYEVDVPDGPSEMLLDVPRYDFNWQLEYRLSEPLDLPKGSRINVSAWYDNSEDNPANPDPNKRVKWGDQTDEEMLVGYVEYVLSKEADSEQSK